MTGAGSRVDPMCAAALAYAERGIKVFPTHSIIERPEGRYCSCGKPAAGEEADKGWCRQAGKHPRTKHGFKDATTDAKTIARWWKQWPGSYIGAPTGAINGVFVLDDDPRHGRGIGALEDQIGVLPSTLTQQTGGGGRHLFYAHPGFTLRNKIAIVDGLDARGDGGYVLLAPSGHVTGGVYAWIGPALGMGTLAPVPAALLELFEREEKAPPPPIPPGTVEVTDRLVQAVARTVMNDARNATEGSRNRMLHKAAFTLAGFIPHGKLTAIEIHDLIGPIGEAQGQDAVQTRKSIDSGIRSGEASPLTVRDRVRQGRDFTDEEAPPERGKGGASSSATMEDFVEGASVSQDAIDDAAADFEETEGGKRGPALDRLAEMFAEEHQAQLMYTETGQWYRYAGSHWATVSNDPVEQVVADWLRRMRREWKKRRLTGAAPSSPRTKTIKEIMRLASTGEGRLGVVEVRELNPNPFWIPCLNGVYDRQTRQLLPHDPKHRITYCLPFNFDAAATCPRFDQFLAEVLITQDGDPCEEWIDLMQMWFGYLLTGDMSAHLTYVFFGEGRNGKGVLTNILERLLGPQLCTTISVEQLGTEYHRAKLIGKRLGLINELDRRAMIKNGDKVKAIVGGDLIDGRNPYGQPVDFHPETRLIVSTNSLPETRDLSKGYFMRLLIFEFRRTFTDPDIGLLDTLTTELPGILNLALRGLDAYEANGRRFPDSPESAAVMGEYIRSEDLVGQFVGEHYEIGEGRRCLFDPFYSGFSRWTKDAGVRDPMTKNAVGRRLQALGFKKRDGGIDGSHGVVYLGLCIKPDSPYRRAAAQQSMDDTAPPEWHTS